MRKAIAICVILMVLLAGVLYAQALPAFRNRELVRSTIQNSADRVVTVLETVLDQKTLDAVETALFPPATEAETKAAKQRAIDLLEQKGVAADDAALIILKEAVKPVVAEPIVTPIEEIVP